MEEEGGGEGEDWREGGGMSMSGGDEGMGNHFLKF